MKTNKLIKIKKSVIGEVRAPGSKSFTNRALFIGAIAPHPVKIVNPLKSDDTDAMVDCLKKLGITVTSGKNFIKVNGSIKDIKDKKYELNARLSGTTIRFILALLCIVPGIKILRGDSELNKRPIGPLVDALRQLGADIEYMGKGGFPPLRISSSSLRSGNILMDGRVSSQYVSAILMILPHLPKVSIKIDGEQVSRSYIDMTIGIMKTFGIKVRNKGYKNYELAGKSGYTAKKYSVEGDFSSVGYFFAIAALSGSKITVHNLNPDSLQPDRKILEVLRSMGNAVKYGKNSVTLEGHGVRPVSVNMIDFPDQAQTLAVLAAFAKGRTVLSGLQSLRLKETDRLQALINELKKMNIRTELKHDTLAVQGGAPRPARIKTYGDHRMAMAFAVAKAGLKGMKIENPEVVAKTFPNFWEELKSILPRTQSDNSKNIILIGMRNSGKSTVLKILAKKLEMNPLDTDELVVSRAGMNIEEIVKKKGWEYFRDVESKIVKKISHSSSTLIATGGGAVMRAQNVEYLKSKGIFVFLNAKAKILISRNKKLSKKPKLTGEINVEKEVSALLKERIATYKELSDITVSVDNKTPENIVDEIIMKLKNI